MVFINNPNDVTMVPSGGSAQRAILMAAARSTPGQTFEQAAVTNSIYRNNGLICQQKMCQSMTGCDSKLGCPEHPDWNKVLQFCGPIRTGGVYSDGAWWTLGPADAQQQLLSATQQSVGMPVLPTPFNQSGMY